jgi:2-polyprenyl-3-methyl-5-hydroxy-6-metoxy-1,4-benzoquinol methylase
VEYAVTMRAITVRPYRRNNMIINKELDHGKAFDWGRASQDYAKFRDIYPPEFYEKITAMGLCVKGQRVLDLGTGTGVLPRNLYKCGAKFTGADIAENQIAQAKKLSAEAGMDIEYIVASAEEVDFPAASFDVITACQCFFYFDKSVVYPKIHRLLKDGGRLCVAYLMWLPEESEIAAGSERLVLKHNPAWTGHSFKKIEPSSLEFPPELFEIEAAEGFDLAVPFTRESWQGRMRACRGIGASSLSPAEIAAFEKEHAAYLSGVPEKFDILHFASVLVLRKV